MVALVLRLAVALVADVAVIVVEREAGDVVIIRRISAPSIQCICRLYSTRAHGSNAPRRLPTRAVQLPMATAPTHSALVTRREKEIHACTH